MSAVSRAAVEDFLFHEADLLDAWRLEEWAALFTDDARYLVPATDRPDDSPASSLYLIYDDHGRLVERARRLLKRAAHAEFPHSRTRHTVTNVRLLENGGDTARVSCNFVVYRSKREVMDIYPGRSEYELLVSDAAGFRIRLKKSVLDLEALRPHGKLSIIL
ncbi:aromatic-ring-hydroxylating dioxygenase subunit beta [Vineibacter terrae]|uniref:aromatic-ring-hydroxylating dioxygenase subunit beta n=1 Tax=Vineibacter terrae TaxID=2586908 RepID=UPI002E38231C|nr:aromatic-ring-hydroxylating dioxygenase subunit beta [Vineibacter terrae]HEX2890297.1 aromatic-ring-hydroxylating dioxygenase subunit beta [Vineibacter terrae]